MISQYGSGTFAAVLLCVGNSYLQGATPVLRRFVASLVDEVFSDPMVRVSGSRHVDVSLMRKPGLLCVNLVNTGGPHGDPDVFAYDEIPRLGPLTVRIRSTREPQDVFLEPNGRRVDWRYEGGAIVLAIDDLEVHDLVVIKE